MIPSIHFRHDWTFLWERQNWYDFTFISVFFENDTHFGTVEFSVALLGFHVRASWDMGETPARARIIRLAEKFSDDSYLNRKE